MSKAEYTFSRRRKMGMSAVLAFCTLLTVGVISVLFFEYRPNYNALGALSTVSMDVVCMFVVLILIMSITLVKDSISRTSKLFLCLMLGTMWGLFFDFLTWASDGTLSFAGWTYVFTVASLIAGSVLAGVLVLYLANYMDDMYGLKGAYKPAVICAICNLASFVLTVILALTKQAFTYVDGHYQTGVLYDYITIIPVLTLVVMAVYAMIHVKIIGVHDVVAVTGYLIIMISGALIESSYSIGTTYVAISIADVYIFVMLQNKLIGRVKKQKDMLARDVEQWKRKSNTDEVTGLFNRHAYEEAVNFMDADTIKDSFVYVSLDVNGLKVVNDTLGHDAGDELITGAAECMKQCFGAYGKLYRIGGDEFIALINADADELETIKKDFDETVKSWFGKICNYLTISCGYVTRQEAKDKTIHQIANLADERMYEDKANYYHNKGLDRRGRRDAHVALCDLYTKILKVNLTEDSFQIINMNSVEQINEKGFSRSIFTWLHDFGTMGQVHPDDLEEYLSKTTPEFLKNYFKEGNTSLMIHYRRQFTDCFKRVMMEMIPANDYTDNMQTIFLYVKIIE